MPASKEFTIVLDDQPGTLGRTCRALADRSVNILAFQSQPIGGRAVFRFVPDNPNTARAVLDSHKMTYLESDIAQVKASHRPGELARLAARLGDAGININYAYCGLETGTNTPLVFFGVTEVAKAIPLLEEAAAAART